MRLALTHVLAIGMLLAMSCGSRTAAQQPRPINIPSGQLLAFPPGVRAAIRIVNTKDGPVVEANAKGVVYHGLWFTIKYADGYVEFKLLGPTLLHVRNFRAN